MAHRISGESGEASSHYRSLTVAAQRITAAEIGSAGARSSRPAICVLNGLASPGLNNSATYGLRVIAPGDGAFSRKHSSLPEGLFTRVS